MITDNQVYKYNCDWWISKPRTIKRIGIKQVKSYKKYPMCIINGGLWILRPGITRKISKSRAVGYMDDPSMVMSNSDRDELLYYKSRIMGMGASPWKYQLISEYLSWAKKCFATVNRGGLVVTNWAGRELDQAGWREEFQSTLNRRLNLKVSPGCYWRKIDAMHQTDLRRDQRVLHDFIQRRIRVYQFSTQEVRSRFKHLLSSHGD